MSSCNLKGMDHHARVCISSPWLMANDTLMPSGLFPRNTLKLSNFFVCFVWRRVNVECCVVAATTWTRQWVVKSRGHTLMTSATFFPSSFNQGHCPDFICTEHNRKIHPMRTSYLNCPLQKMLTKTKSVTSRCHWQVSTVLYPDHLMINMLPSPEIGTFALLSPSLACLVFA